MYPIIIPAGKPRKEIDDYYFNKHLSTPEIISDLYQLKKEVNSGLNFMSQTAGGRGWYGAPVPGAYLPKDRKKVNAKMNAQRALEAGKNATSKAASTNLVGSTALGAISGFARTQDFGGAIGGGLIGAAIHLATRQCIEDGSLEINGGTRLTERQKTQLALQIATYVLILLLSYNIMGINVGTMLGGGPVGEEKVLLNDAAEIYNELQKIMGKSAFDEWKSNAMEILKKNPSGDEKVIHMENYFDIMALLVEYLKDKPSSNRRNNTKKLKKN